MTPRATAADLARLRAQLSGGARTTTYEPRRLPAAAIDPPIPLRLGLGWPHPMPLEPEIIAGGFIVRIPAGGAVLFDPYTMAVLDADYPFGNCQYNVLDFPTAWNVPVTSTTNWCDILSFGDDLVRVNALSMPELQIPAALDDPPAIPYLVKGAPPDHYGTVEENATEKRVFAVSRWSVQAWGGAGETAQLYPSDTTGRRQTVGQRLIRSTDEAWLGQLYFTGYTWDDYSGEWLFSATNVSMTLVSPYLSDTTVAATVKMPLVELADQGESQTTSSSTEALPEIQCSYVAYGTQSQACAYTSGGGGTFGAVKWVDSAVIRCPMDASVLNEDAIKEWSGSESLSQEFAGHTVNYAAENVKTVTYRAVTKQVDTDTPFVLGTGDPLSSVGQSISADENHLFYGGETDTGWAPSDIVETHLGDSVFDRTLYDQGLGTKTRYLQQQDGSFIVSGGGANLITVAFSKTLETGTDFDIQAWDIYFDDRIGSEDWATGGAMSLYYNPATGTYPAAEYGAIGEPPNQPPAIVSEINGMLQDVIDKYVGLPRYTAGPGQAIYLVNDSVIDPHGTSTLEFTTTDFVLYDDENSVFISVVSAMSASQPYGGSVSAEIGVHLKISSPAGVFTKLLFSTTLSNYSSILPEQQVGSFNGEYWEAVLSPQIRAVFAPLYQEQGSFQGAHYTTADEIGNGAIPFFGFRFKLALHDYSAISTLDNNNAANGTVHFIPHNLVEALYAFVYSVSFGLDYYRYVVTIDQHRDAIVAGLFTDPIYIQVLGIVETDWTDQLSAAVAAADEVQLCRS